LSITTTTTEAFSTGTSKTQLSVDNKKDLAMVLSCLGTLLGHHRIVIIVVDYVVVVRHLCQLDPRKRFSGHP
jgi:hypothetical protein